MRSTFLIFAKCDVWLISQCRKDLTSCIQHLSFAEVAVRRSHRNSQGKQVVRLYVVRQILQTGKYILPPWELSLHWATFSLYNKNLIWYLSNTRVPTRPLKSRKITVPVQYFSINFSSLTTKLPFLIDIYYCVLAISAIHKDVFIYKIIMHHFVLRLKVN